MSPVLFSAKQTPSISELYVFGDSLSDTGTLFRATNGLYPPNPPYFQGRYSNGRVWVEYLADRLHLPSDKIKNFACGGATTVSDGNNPVPGLLFQVQSFTQSHPNVSSNALYVLWAGANDYLQGTTNPAPPVANLQKAVELLAQMGGANILVANLPDLGQLPATRNSANSNHLSSVTQAHNSSLRRSLKQLNQQYSQLQIVMLDANALYRQAITEPSGFGFTNVMQSCLSNSQPCSNPDQFLFWDSIHPTTKGHQILANTASAELEAGLLIPIGL